MVIGMDTRNIYFLVVLPDFKNDGEPTSLLVLRVFLLGGSAASVVCFMCISAGGGLLEF